VSGTLKLTREGFGTELRRGTFRISVDDQDAGTIERHETIGKPLEPGQHTLRIHAGRYSSRDQAFAVADGEVVSFRTHGAMVWPRWAASFVKPDLGISLKRE
jgi:hypothetical protein